MIGNNLIPRHTFGILESCPKDHSAMIFLNWLDESGYVSRIMLSVAVHSDNNACPEEFGGFDAGLGGRTFAPIDGMM